MNIRTMKNSIYEISSKILTGALEVLENRILNVINPYVVTSQWCVANSKNCEVYRSINMMPVYEIVCELISKIENSIITTF